MIDSLKSTFPLFSNDLLLEIEKNATYKTCKPGELLIRTGQYVNSLILLKSGEVKIYREGENGGEFFMYYLQPGQACAASILCITKRQTSPIMGKAITEGELILIPLDLMEKWMMEYRCWSDFILNTYRTRLEEMLEVIDNIAFRAMDERLEFYIKRSFKACGCIDIKLSHQDIATELNTSREVISRLLKKMEQRGLIRLHRNHIELLK